MQWLFPILSMVLHYYLSGSRLAKRNELVTKGTYQQIIRKVSANVLEMPCIPLCIYLSGKLSIIFCCQVNSQQISRKKIYSVVFYQLCIDMQLLMFNMCMAKMVSTWVRVFIFCQRKYEVNPTCADVSVGVYEIYRSLMELRLVAQFCCSNC